MQKQTQNYVDIVITPADFQYDKSINFSIQFDTHQGSLDFDLMTQAVLKDNQGNVYQPQSWTGGSGGHHLSGTLIFPPLKGEAEWIRLTFKDIYGVDERVFEWTL